MPGLSAIDIIGWIGAIEVLVGYVLVSARRLDGGSALYQVLNLTGGGLLVINTAYYGAYPSTILNLVWVVVAVLALRTYLRSRPSGA